jgi:hypothetical protein
MHYYARGVHGDYWIETGLHHARHNHQPMLPQPDFAAKKNREEKESNYSIVKVPNQVRERTFIDRITFKR